MKIVIANGENVCLQVRAVFRFKLREKSEVSFIREDEPGLKMESNQIIQYKSK